MNRFGILLTLVLATVLVAPISHAFAAPPAVNQGTNAVSLTPPDRLTGPLAPLAWSDAAVAKAEQYQLGVSGGRGLASPLTDGTDPWVIPGVRQYDFTAGSGLPQSASSTGQPALGDQTYLTPGSTIGVP